MERAVLVNKVKKFFKIQELVDKATYEKWKDNAWDFFGDDILETLLIIRRDILKVPLVINDWAFKGTNQQRGLRTNISPLVKDKTEKGQLYQTLHLAGKAIDAVSSKMSATTMRDLILKNQNLLPYNIRIEGGVNWLHFDMMNKSVKVYVFKG